ncbi:FAD-dependent monooxygenase [Meiothermus sp.]|uniref:NAD(P)/FAD-dependent oxidoreductase n=1 Tax=Meiothermus sp. TaxID=1955249 RepID=UPI00307D4C2A
MKPQYVGKHAVVIGASMGGLLVARILTDYFEQVTLLERDTFPQLGQHRKGVPQGQHAHGLLGRGREVMEQFFPGLTQDLVNMGGLSGDSQNTVRWYAGGKTLAQGSSGLVGLAVSRPLLEGYIRQRLMTMPGVYFVENCDVLGLVSDNHKRVTGVRVVQRNQGHNEEVLSADWVIDASGRGSQSPKWLVAMGFDAPDQETIQVNIGYATAHFRRYPNDADGQVAVVIARSRVSPRGAALIAQEGDRWILSIGGYADDHPPTDLAGFSAYANSLPSPEIQAIVQRGELIGQIQSFKYPQSLRRRYEKLPRFPEGYLVFGDAFCSFNPVYGQGMTSAALQALALQQELVKGTTQLARRFFRTASKVVEIPWEIAAGNDLNDPRIEGKRTPKTQLVNWYLSKLFPVAWKDPVVARAFLKVTNLVAPPPSLMHPAIALRVLWGHLPLQINRPANHRSTESAW